MTKKKPTRNISTLSDKIDSLSAELGEQDTIYAHHLADGMLKSKAFISAYGYRSSLMTERHRVMVLPLVTLLREENLIDISERLHMDKQARLEDLLEMALMAKQRYMVLSEAAHGAVYLKAMATINTMTGDNAPTEVHHMVSVTPEQLEQMSNSQRTESYKRMMSGNLRLIDTDVIEGEVIQ